MSESERSRATLYVGDKILNEDVHDSFYVGIVTCVTDKDRLHEALREISTHLQKQWGSHHHLSYAARFADDEGEMITEISDGATRGLGRALDREMDQLQVSQALLAVFRCPRDDRFHHRDHPSQRIGAGLEAAKMALRKCVEIEHANNLVPLVRNEEGLLVGKQTTVKTREVRYVEPSSAPRTTPTSLSKRADKDVEDRETKPVRRRRWLRSELRKFPREGKRHSERGAFAAVSGRPAV